MNILIAKSPIARILYRIDEIKYYLMYIDNIKSYS